MIGHALVRPPSANFGEGLTTADLGPPDVGLALEQHDRYCAALEQCGVTLTRLPADPGHPDATFVEDTAVPAPGGAVLARPGAGSRAGEVQSIAECLSPPGTRLRAIGPPGTLDGGDVCEAGGHYFIGISGRTNAEGARQLAAFLTGDGCTSTCVDIRALPGILHLKSGMAWLGGRRLLAWDVLVDRPELQGWDVLRIHPAERYAANSVLVNGRALIAAGYPRLEAHLRDLGLGPLVLDVSEFRKMDGGLSCLSIRFEADPREA